MMAILDLFHAQGQPWGVQSLHSLLASLPHCCDGFDAQRTTHASGRLGDDCTIDRYPDYFVEFASTSLVNSIPHAPHG